MTRQHIYDLIDRERQRQQELWNRPHHWGYGDCSHDLPTTLKLSILAEELGEVARAINEKQEPTKELIETAAVCVAWLEALVQTPVGTLFD